MAPFPALSHKASITTSRQFSHVEILVESDLEEPSCESSSSPASICDYTAVTPKPNHHWTLEQEGVLCVLRRWYTNGWRDIAEIFNGHFEAGNHGSELGKQMTGSTLSTKLFSMELLGEESKALMLVFVETLLADEFCAWTNTRVDLEETAQRLGIVLIKRTWEDREAIMRRCSRQSTSPKKKQKINDINGVLGYAAYESEEKELIPQTPTKKRRYPPTPSPSPRRLSQASNTPLKRTRCVPTATPINQYKYLPPTPETSPRALVAQPSSPNTPFQKGNHSQVIASSAKDDVHMFGHCSNWMPRNRLVFRFYDANSSGLNTSTGIRAGAFQHNTGKVPDPADRDSEEFREAATKHFKRIREPTPFISLFESLLPVLHRGMRSCANASIAVIDLHTVIKGQRSSSSGIYLAAQVLNQLGLRGTAFRYRGISEFLVWGEIDSRAIVTTFKVGQLRQFLATAPDVAIILRFPEIQASEDAKEYRSKLAGNPNQVSAACGRVVGKFLAFTGVPDSYVDDIAKKITRNWQLVGNASKPRLRKYFKGVYNGLERARAELEADEFLSRRRHIEAVCSGV
ncbi:MAG: hypothetical protein M1830_008048 [Pleopsidium flavum]|nr:MAG: hypothetical protein M1830_008048 [Pleopsidium flavum]